MFGQHHSSRKASMTCCRRVLIPFLAQLACLIWIVGGSALAAPKDASGQLESTISSCTYVSGGVTHSLSLIQSPLRRLKAVDELQFLRAHPEQSSFPNTAFILVDSDSTPPASGKALWIWYAYVDTAIRPAQIWSGSIITPEPDSKDTYVVISRSISWDISLSVFHVDLNEPIGDFPLKLDPEDYLAWPKPGTPISHLNKTLFDKDISGIRAIKASRSNGLVQIWCEREQKSTPNLTFQFNPKTGEWKQLPEHTSP